MYKALYINMNHYTTINELVGDTRSKINKLQSIVDVLLSGYRTASDMIDEQIDHRKRYTDQLKELNDTLSSIVDGHPALVTEKRVVDAFQEIVNIATESISASNQQLV